MDGTSCADDIRLLHERESFLISFNSDFGFWKQEIGYNIYSILSVIKEARVIVCLQVISKLSLCRGYTLNLNF